MKPLLAGLLGLGAARLAALAGVGVATLALLAFLATRFSGDAPMALLYSDLDLRDAGAMTDVLDKAHIAHDIAAGGTTILVPRDRVAQARLDLARGGLPSGGSVGYEIFDRGDALTAGSFEQAINQTRALEGELSRSIRMIRGVRAVRVHLVLAKREPFAQEQQEAQASVLLTMSGAARMDREGVQAVLNLVAAAVPGLKSQNIAIVDDRGELLARAGQPTGAGAGAGAGGTGASGDELKAATETRLAHEVEEMLGRSLGDGHVRAEAAVDMDYDQTRETSEKYDPDGQVARSTQSVTDASKSTEKDTAVSVQNNLPNPTPAGSSGPGTSDQRQEETTNYEIGKVMRTIVHDQPQIRRISLAVMVDGTMVKGADGKTDWQPRSAAEIAGITTLVRSAIGYDEKRGDSVNIVSMRFNTDADNGTAPAASGFLGFEFDKSDLMAIGRSGLLAALALAALLMVLRPAALRLTAHEPTRLAAAGGARAMHGSMAANGVLGAGGTGAGGAALLTDESMISMGNVEGQLRAASVRRIADLVERHPQEALAVMRGWMAQEAS